MKIPTIKQDVVLGKREYVDVEKFLSLNMTENFVAFVNPITDTKMTRKDKRI